LTGVKAPPASDADAAGMNKGKVVTLDVRPDIKRGQEPFGRIMRAVADLAPGQKLLLLAPFEPVPLFRVMAARGFAHTAERAPSGHWEVLFENGAELTSEQRQSAAPQHPSHSIEIDARGLEPPMPMVRILEALETLPREKAVVAHTDRRPVFLLDELPRRGFAGETQQTSDGSYITRIHRHS
jgi:uncharacterized protein (DUF2249 family)